MMIMMTIARTTAPPRALATSIAEQSAANFDMYSRQKNSDSRGLHAIVDFLLDDPLSDVLDVDALFEQLWAMAIVEPSIRELLDELYEAYLVFIEDKLRELGVEEPRADALVIMAILEGVPQFVGRGRRWSDHAQSSVAAIHAFLDARYPEAGE